MLLATRVPKYCIVRRILLKALVGIASRVESCHIIKLEAMLELRLIAAL